MSGWCGKRRREPKLEDYVWPDTMRYARRSIRKALAPQREYRE